MSGVTIEDARHRFGAIQATLAADNHRRPIKVGCAALTSQDSATELIKRADAELPASRPTPAGRTPRRDHGPVREP
jgi:hypothetical protein